MNRGPLGNESDERLAILAGQGSELAFEAIVERYRLPLTRHCARLAAAGQAEDAVQETFVKAFRALERGEQVVMLGPWLHRVAHNTALNSLRARGLCDQPLDELAAGADTTTAAVERRLGLRDTVTAVQALPPRQRSAIVQHELEGRSYEEIAGRLGVTSGAVRQLLNRARTSLRAGAAALVAPLAPFSRLATSMSDAPAVGRVAELCGSGGSGLAVKLCATAALTGAIAGGIPPASEVAPNVRRDDGDARAATRPGATKAPVAQAAAAASAGTASSGRGRPSSASRRRAVGRTEPGRPIRAAARRRAEGPAGGRHGHPAGQREAGRHGEGAATRQRPAPEEEHYGTRPQRDVQQSSSIAPRQPLPDAPRPGEPQAGSEPRR